MRLSQHLNVQVIQLKSIFRFVALTYQGIISVELFLSAYFKLGDDEVAFTIDFFLLTPQKLSFSLPIYLTHFSIVKNFLLMKSFITAMRQKTNRLLKITLILNNLNFEVLS